MTLFLIMLAGAVMLGERYANETVPILRNITAKEICYRRKACWNIYQQYMETDNKVIAGLIEGWQQILAKPNATILPFAGVQCKNGDSQCNFT